MRIRYYPYFCWVSDAYPLAVCEPSVRALLEVYPHPALIELSSADRRPPYKHSKSRKYWPYESPAVRRQKLFETWRRIVTLLDARIQGVKDALPLPSGDERGHALKAFEDALDAVVCAWSEPASSTGGREHSETKSR